ncbi:MAG: hypothetical protein IT356_12560 [Gemmatimonadaceae bacterium]|nr:hypothetical protein [Gemmatimonadaceae bacterium]
MSARVENPEIHEEDGSEGSALAPLSLPNDAMVDVQVTTAKKFPRSVTRFRKEAEALACLDEETAGECMYALPRAGKTIEGPSARFAEILLYAWGNSRAEAVVIEEGPTHVKAQGTFYDLERNVAVRKIVARRITNAQGRRYNDDMIGTTGNAACSIALRNAVFAGIPKAIWKAIYQKSRLTSIGKAGTLTQTRQKLLEHFGKMGVSQERVFAFLGVEGIEDMKEDQVITMRGVANAIRDGEATVEDTFNPRTTAGAEATPNLNERLAKKTAPPPEMTDAEIAAQDAKREAK